jgi:dihydroorotase
LNLLLRNSHVISPAQNINGRFDILIVNGVINHLGVTWQHVREVIEFDMTGKIVAPGFFDMHVHFREPGQTYKEDIITGALAAAFGGFTGVLCMPNTKPPFDNVDVIKHNIDKAKDNIVNVHNTCCATIGREGKRIADIRKLNEIGALAVTDDGSPIEDDEIMKEALGLSAEINIPVLHHCEISRLSDDGVMNEGEISKKLNVKGIPNSSEYEIIKRDIKFTKEINGSHYHVQHISTKEGVELVRKAKAQGLNVSAEACPHHIILTDESILKYGTNAKMNPPLGNREDDDAIIEGLKDGTIDVICTDHAPHSDEEKKLPFEKAPFGIVGLETAIGLVNTYLVEKGVLSIEDMVYKMSINPREILHLPEIKISEGEVANLTILNLDSKWKVDVNQFHSKSRNSPYRGWELKGKPAGIINNYKYLIYA